MDIALALGGGGVKGFAHIGVLRVLEREGFRIRAIAGTSAGGLCGVFWAAGYRSDQIESLMLTLDQNHLYDRQPGDGPAMLSLAGLSSALIHQLGHLDFKDLEVPFAVTAVDYERAEQVTLQEGSVTEAVLATIAVPGIFPPKLLGERVLIDGGVLNPVPTDLARSLAPGLPVIAVVLAPPIKDWVVKPSPRLLTSLPFLSTYIARLRIAQAFNIFLRSVDMGGAMLTDLKLRIDRPEVVIRPKVAHIGLLDVVDIKQVIQLGEEAAEESLPDLYRAVSWRGWLHRQLDINNPTSFVQRFTNKNDGS